MKKNKITITESQLKHIVNECVNNIVNESFVDTMQGAWNGAKMGNNKIQSQDSSRQNILNTFNNISQYFDKALNSLSQNEIEDAKMWCQYGKRMCQDIPKIYRQ